MSERFNKDAKSVRREIIFQILLIHVQFSFYFHFPIDLAPNRIPFCAKSIEKCYLKLKFGLAEQDSEKISLCLDFS